MREKSEYIFIAFYIASIVTALVITAIMAYSFHRQNIQAGFDLSREKESSEMLLQERDQLNMQLKDICIELPQHSSCRWWKEYSERG